MAKKFYVVWRGAKTGVFHDWPTTHALVDGFAGAQYKSFPTLAEAEARVSQRRAGAQHSARHAGKPRVVRTDHADAVAAFDTVIFCDGACEPNPGKAGSGMAVYRAGELESLWYGAYNPAGTNNTAELNALLQALMLAKTEIEADNTVQVRSDSSYGLNAVTKWAAGWKKRGWRKAEGEIKNLEIIQELYALYQEIEDDVNLQHVSAHVGIEGNELADRMAMLAVERREVRMAQIRRRAGHRQTAEDARGLRRASLQAAQRPEEFADVGASASGCSIAAKCPPRGNSVQRCTLKKRCAHSRGGCERSFGKHRERRRHVVATPVFCLTAFGNPAWWTGVHHVVVRHERAADAARDPVDHRVGQHLVLREAGSRSPSQSLQR